jgi:CHASE3 domain sensor protein
MEPGGFKPAETAFFKIAFGFSVAMLIIIAFISFKQLNEVNKAQHRVIRSRDRQIGVERLFSIVKDAERNPKGVYYIRQ